jgi:vesicle-fusing ATPase
MPQQESSRYYDSPPNREIPRQQYSSGQGSPHQQYSLDENRGPSSDASTPRVIIVHPEQNKDAATGYRNRCVVAPQDFAPKPGAAFTNNAGLFGGRPDVYLLLEHNAKSFVVTATPVAGQPPGQIAMNGLQRDWLDVVFRDGVRAQLYTGPKPPLASIDVDIEFFKPPDVTNHQFDQDDLAESFAETFQQDIFAPRQPGMWEYGFGEAPKTKVRFKYMVRSIQFFDSGLEKPGEPTTSFSERGMLLPGQTVVNLYKADTAGNSALRIKSSETRPAANAIIRPDFKFADMGIGGLDEEFSTIFRRAFASRVFPPGLVEQMGISHVKGLLLYGPPGTGKTLIARQIGKMLNARPPKIINGPEILNKYVGQSEENVRKMFAEAEEEYKDRKEESDLHIIIFDELDAVCKQRGSSSGGGTGVGDSVVNQLLSKLDGVDQLNNILLIGMTNRKDMIDDALLRPGRLEVHMEISLPDEHGRVQILNIHTAKIRAINKLGEDVDLNELAHVTKNYSGAELNGLVKAALSYAFTRHTKIGDVTGVQGNPEDVMLTRDDFTRALEDVKPAFGVSEEELASSAPYGIVHYSLHIEMILRNGMNFVEQLRRPENAPLFSVLIHGPRGAGKTALAAEIGLKSEFPFVKLIRPIDAGTNEPAKLDYLRRAFSDAYKSAVSMVILDRIETLIDWNPIGPRFSNAVVQYLSAILQTAPPKGRRLLIVATTSQRTMLEQHGTLEFDREIAVPAVKDFHELSALLGASGKLSDQAELDETLNELQSLTGSQTVGIGVKAVFSAIETALVRTDQPLPLSLAAELSEIISTRNPLVN